MSSAKLRMKASIMKRSKTRFNSEDLSYANGDIEKEEKSGGENADLAASDLNETRPKRVESTRLLQRASRRSNGVNILKSIRRKLPWNRRPNSTLEGGSGGDVNDSDDSDGFGTISAKNSTKQTKSKSRAICPMPSPFHAIRKSNSSRRTDKDLPPAMHFGHLNSQDDPVVESSANSQDECNRDLIVSDQTNGFERDSPSLDEQYSSTNPSSLTVQLFQLPKNGWYWGPLTRNEAEEKLVDQPDGAFLVRDSSDDRYLLSLSFRSFGKTLHTRIEHCNGIFSFYAQSPSEGHRSIVDLIDHSMNYSQSGVFCYSRARMPGAPSYPVRLTKPVSRFTQVRSLQYLCRFVIRQYTRVDLIDELPLPKPIKGYIEEGHY